MTREEFNEILDKILPSIVSGMVRPTEPIPTDLDFCTEFRQLLQADMNLANHENAFLRQLLSNDKVLNLLIKAIQDQLANCDLRLVTQVLKGLMSPEMLKKLNGIQVGALNNPHPANHPASIITQDASRRMVTDTQINSWNGKANASHGGHVPALETANNARYLRNDGTWQDIAPVEIGAAPAGHGLGTSVPNILNKSLNDDTLMSGWYYTNDASIANTGLPVAAYIISHQLHGNYSKSQLAINTSTAAVYVRGYAGNGTTGTWGAWQMMASTKSPALSGTPTAPTAAAATNNTQIATTAFVKAIAAPLSHAHNYAASASAGGAANTAVKLATARALKLGNTAKNFDGSANLTWTLAEMGATAATMGGIVGGSLAPNGWVKFANGLILQWGASSNCTNSTTNCPFPIAFPTMSFSAVGIHLTSTGRPIAVTVTGLNNRYANFFLYDTEAHTGVNGVVYWIAIGI